LDIRLEELEVSPEQLKVGATGSVVNRQNWLDADQLGKDVDQLISTTAVKKKLPIFPFNRNQIEAGKIYYLRHANHTYYFITKKTGTNWIVATNWTEKEQE
jgi:hypothetical protein